MKTRIAQAIKIFGIVALVAAFAAAAFPTPGFAAPATASAIRGGYGKVIVQVTASDPSGEIASMPVSGALIEVLASNGTTVMKTTTDSNGNAHLGLDEGGYRLKVTARGFYSNGARIVVKNSMVQDVSIHLTRAANSVPTR